MREVILGILIGVVAGLNFVVLPAIREEGEETRRLVLELVHMQISARSKGPLHAYAVNLDDRLCVTNVVDDGKLVYP